MALICVEPSAQVLLPVELPLAALWYGRRESQCDSREQGPSYAGIGDEYLGRCHLLTTARDHATIAHADVVAVVRLQRDALVTVPHHCKLLVLADIVSVAGHVILLHQMVLLG